MNIALVHRRCLQASGEDIAFEAEAGLLEARGHRVRRYEVPNQEPLTRSAGRMALAALWEGSRQWELQDFLAATEPDVAHFHNAFPLTPAAYRAVPRRTAIVQTLHNFRLICPGGALLRAGTVCDLCVGRLPWAGIRHGCYRSDRAATAVVSGMEQLHRASGTWRRVDAWVALTDFARTLFIRGGLPAAAVRVKPNFVDPDPGTGGHEGDHLLFVGRLEEQKGVYTLFDAWQRSAPMKLRIIGQGSLQPLVNVFARQHHLVEYAGPQPRHVVMAELQSARALVVPSLSYENFPFVVAEAFATGLPVLISDAANAAGLVEPGSTGWSFRAGDGAALAAAVRQIAALDSLDAMGRRARSRFRERYAANKNYRMLCGIYRDAIRKRQTA